MASVSGVDTSTVPQLAHSSTSKEDMLCKSLALKWLPQSLISTAAGLPG